MAGRNEIDCLNKNCAVVSDDERYIVCWLCYGLCHFKCSGLPVLIAESLTKHKGLHWCCTGCRKIGVDFFKFFQQQKKGFLEIQNKMSDLSGSISSYGKLFDDYKSLTTLNSPPQLSPKRRKSARTSNKTTSAQPNSKPSAKSINTEICIIPEVSSNATNFQPECVQTSPSPSKQFQSTSHGIQNNPVPVINTSSSISNYLDVNPSTSTKCGQIIPKQLNIIPPKKSIFISRFAFDTTVDDIDNYIKSKLNNCPVILIRKFTYSEPRNITSFKLTVPFDYYDKIIDQNFWPPNTFVREYIIKNNPRINNIVRLQTSDNPVPKN